jgi:hypothetical protein
MQNGTSWPQEPKQQVLGAKQLFLDLSDYWLVAPESKLRTLPLGGCDPWTFSAGPRDRKTRRRGRVHRL